ncbi:DUF2306 domain-containing protein [Bacillus swezeyi]|uniref:DUF2306 domain-containing protein n=2 Tax=Bacillus swezeyi TaxID=1925020 RepID=A0A1R1QK39_9BACI|nr:DUF2306 domain-containing protein [Bacillus swezeyi]MEC1262092.1 DUF2306 domain-containing protein [Bacillus swezeyi]MED2928496.1 DUF2306 domain-containing protein [Bacillus swezeyi]MED2942475.1 DUF2306 domain-containing protein [Bacillus swezeyi]MED2964123.1 DUF2306 domain-containing protein [Bacillus swezeyi]MED3074004.1 DUF2306 domain-containing protein [Bacillus swezeyi]
MIMLVTIYILYTLFANLIHDPHSTAFLIHKTNLRASFDLPVWLNVMYVHVIAACVAMLAGAVNFSGRLLKSCRKFHRLNGYIYVVCVMIVTLSSGYMAPNSTGGRIVSIAFNMVNMYWPFATVISVIQARRKQFHKHRKWMIRSYLFCFTNLFIHLITFVCHSGFGLIYETSYTIGVYGAIVLNVAIAECIIRYIFRKAPNTWHAAVNG